MRALSLPGMDAARRVRANPGMSSSVIPLTRLRVPLGGQEIELQQLDHEAGGMSLLRTRIRERSRFTVFDVDAATAEAWGEALLRWARAQAAKEAGP
ncbi:MAG TPA: hypothetical protein VFZ93_10990 [Albitalea sp.]